MNNIFLSGLSWLYGSLVIIDIIGYLPSIIEMYKGKNPVNIYTWGIWFTSNLIALAYVYFINGDQLIILVTGINTIMNIILIILSVRIKLKNKQKTSKQAIE